MNKIKFRNKFLMAVTLFLGFFQIYSCAEQEKPGNGQHALSIIGYNYTDQSIEFYVNGHGGDLLGVSSETSGGGGQVCCIVWRDGTPLPQKVHVKWIIDSCQYLTKPNMNGNRLISSHDFFKEEDVELNSPVPVDPSYFEVHFYPDKHVEVAIAKEFSEPRLKLSKSRKRPLRPCTEGELK